MATRSSATQRTQGTAPAEGGAARHREVVLALRRIIRAADLYSRRLAKESGLTMPQAVILDSVSELGEVTTRSIAESVNLSQGTVTTIMDRLAQRGLIVRYRSLSDRRVVHARLTGAGRAALRAAAPLLHDRFMAAFQELPQCRQEEIIAALGDVAEMLGARDGEVGALLGVAPPLPDGAEGGNGIPPS